jgi:hypothetical protein
MFKVKSKYQTVSYIDEIIILSVSFNMEVVWFTRY